MNIALIPARGGSKRIPRKNIKNFFGKPIIAWTIELAIKSGCFDKVIVSTDDKEIAEVAEFYGAEIPFMRSEKLSDDHTVLNSVISDAIKRLNLDINYLCVILPTAPLIQVEDIQRGLKELISKPDFAFAFTVTDFGFPIQRALKIKNELVSMFEPSHINTRSQDLETAWHDAGQFYWGKPSSWLREIPMFGPKSIPIKLPRFRVQDIDSMEDWLRAEFIFKQINKL